jgi:hypothetical protein
MRRYIITGLVSALLLPNVSLAALSFNDVIGQSIINSSGSSGGSFLMSVSVAVQSRNTVEVKFLQAMIDWSSLDISALETGGSLGNVVKIMINCKDKSYTPGEFATKDAYSIRDYKAGRAYKWGKYETGEVIMGSNQGPLLTKYFEKVCAYTAQN